MENQRLLDRLLIPETLVKMVSSSSAGFFPLPHSSPIQSVGTEEDPGADTEIHSTGLSTRAALRS